MTTSQMALLGGSTSDPSFASVTLLCHFDGTNGSTTIVDSSSIARTMTATGNAQLTTTGSQFGSACLALDGSGDTVTTPDSVGLDFGSGNFTMECWVNPAGVLQYNILTRYTSGFAGWIWSTTNFLATTSGSSWDVTINFSSTPTAGVWNYMSIVRSGDTWTAYLNGTSIGSASVSGTVTATTDIFTIGKRAGQSDFSGTVDEMRITKGVARYTSNYTTPSLPFPNQ